MKLKLLILGCIATSLIPMDPPPKLLFAFEETYSQSDFHSIGLNDFILLKDEVEGLCKKPLRNISKEFNDTKILRIHSEGEIVKMDCETIDLQLRRECLIARDILQSITVSNSVISHTFAQDTYNQACKRYNNAFNILAIYFNLKCYNSLEKLHQVLSEFINSESAAKQHSSKRELDPETQKLFYSLNDLAVREKERRVAITPKAFISPVTTKDLVEALAVEPNGRPAQRAIQDGTVNRDAARALLKNLQEPTQESIDSIEIIFFMAFEHFISGYNRGADKGLHEAENVLGELKKIHDLKKNKYSIEGKRYPLAQQKFANAKTTSLAHIRDTSANRSSNASDYSLEKFLRDDATATRKNEPSSEEVSAVTADPIKKIEPLNSARSGQRTINESEKAVKEKDEVASSQVQAQPAPSSQSATPLSLLKSAWKNCKKAGKGTGKGIKYVWNKLPFN